MKIFFCLFVLHCAAFADAQIKLVRIAQNVPLAVDIKTPNDGSNRLFIGLQSGKILVYDGRRILTTPFLDISRSVMCCGEEGLLSLSFHPNYRDNGFLYVYYVSTAGNLILSRYKVSKQSNVALAGSRKILLKIPHGQSKLHNGGEIQFGKDGYLYLSVGDGGTFGDPNNHAQNLGTLLGKILRIDVGGAFPYSIPADNPFLNKAGARKEIWAYGLRNPWRFSFDRKDGSMYIGDVGQEIWEEVNFQSSQSIGGENYGWRKLEGTHCFNPSTNCNDGSTKLPIIEYRHTHSQGCAVTGGYVYRGSQIPSLVGTYLYSDYCSGIVWGAKRIASKWIISQLLLTRKNISTFGQGPSGELYVADHSPSGAIYRIAPAR